MHRFLIQDARPDAQGRLDLTPIARQLQRVLRARPGTEVLILDGSGRAYRTVLVELDGSTARGEVQETVQLPEPVVHLTLLQCALKADKFEWVLQKGTELGVSCFVPVVSIRTVVRPVAALEKKRDRWETILREATEQCGRGRVPTLAPARAWDTARHYPHLAPAARHSQPRLRLLPWEDADAHTPGLSQAVTSWQESRQAVPQTSASQTSAPEISLPETALSQTGASIACAIGPEGGWAADEVAAAQAAGWQTVHLGPRILRAETAALAAATLILHACGELNL